MISTGRRSRRYRTPPTATRRCGPTRRAATCADCPLLQQRVLAVLDALGDLGHAIRSRRNGVLELDRRLNRPLVVADQLENFLDRRVPLPEGDVLSAAAHLVLLPILHVDMRNPVVVFLDELD